jgi:hypothetical protein
MTVYEAIRHRFGVDLPSAYAQGGMPSVEAVLRAQLFQAAENAVNLGGPSGGTEVDLAHLADFMGHLVLALHGHGEDLSSLDR